MSTVILLSSCTFTQHVSNAYNTCNDVHMSIHVQCTLAYVSSCLMYTYICTQHVNSCIVYTCSICEFMYNVHSSLTQFMHIYTACFTMYIWVHVYSSNSTCTMYTVLLLSSCTFTQHVLQCTYEFMYTVVTVHVQCTQFSYSVHAH